MLRSLHYPLIVRILFYFYTFVFCASALAENERTIFDAAFRAYKAQDEKTLARDYELLQAQNYILTPYLAYWQLLLRLDKSDPVEVKAFMTQYADYPFTARVRAEFLKSLAKKQSWSIFFEEYPLVEKPEPALVCLATSGRFALGQTPAPDEMKTLWLTGSELPSVCDDLFDTLKQKNLLTDDDGWARIRLAFQANHINVAQSATRWLQSPLDKAHLKQADKVYENPRRTLEKSQVSAKTRWGRELILYALERVARTQPSLAEDLWAQKKSLFTSNDQDYFWGRLALHAARNHLPEALTLYKSAGATPLDRDQLAWKARAILRTRNWDNLLDVIADMPSDTQNEAAWRYWKARAMKEKGNTVAANALLIPLSKERHFYGILAEEELGDTLSQPPVSYRANEAEIAAIQKIPGVQRAVELMQMDMRWEAKSEWQMVTRDFDDRQLITAAELAFRQEWYDLAISTADKTQLTHDFILRYPTPYRETLDTYTKDNQLDEAWVYGLIRQESRFMSIARSGVGAAGLMQVMPATANWIAKKMKLNDYHPGLIHRIDTNIQLGTFYLRHVLDLMNNQPLLATAAYNAGPRRPLRWADEKPMEGAVYAETIPFTETRDYTQKVMVNAYFYAHRLGEKLQSLKQRLGMVMGQSPSTSNDNEDPQEQP